MVPPQLASVQDDPAAGTDCPLGPECSLGVGGSGVDGLGVDGLGRETAELELPLTPHVSQ